MWHQRLKPEYLEDSILKRVQEKLGKMYENTDVRKRAERLAYKFAHTAPESRMKRDYMSLVNEGSDAIYSSIIKERR